MSLRYILIILLLMWAASADQKIDELTARLDDIPPKTEALGWENHP